MLKFEKNLHREIAFLRTKLYHRDVHNLQRGTQCRLPKCNIAIKGQVYEYFPNLRCIDLTEKKSFVYLNFTNLC